MLPTISYKVISDLCANISFLKKEYKRLQNEYIELDKNSNSLFKDGMQESGRVWYNSFVDIYNANLNMSRIRQEYYKYFDDLGIGEYIDELIELRPPIYANDVCMTIYEGFESMVKDKEHKRRKKLCNIILERLSDIETK